MLRLAPSHPPLWRTDTSLQLGREGSVVIDDVSHWQEKLLDALRDGIPDAMLAPLAVSLGATPAAAARFVQSIDGALVPAPEAPLPARAELPDRLPFAEGEALAQGWRAAGVELASLTRWPERSPEGGLPTFVVADGLVDPRRAAQLMADDVTHLPIELAGDRVIVGPVVVPGRTACIACLHAERTDLDPGWPLVAAQLIDRRHPDTDLALLMEGALVGARLLRGADAIGLGDATVSVTLSGPDARRTRRAHRPHPRCLCRSPEGTVSADADATRSAPTTTGSAFARPA